MATAAKRLGGTIVRHNRVLGIEQLPSGEFRVSTEQGDITCEHVVNAAGCYADRVSAWLGVQTRFANIKHQYVVTGPVQEFLDRDGEIPVMRDPYCSAYYRQEQKSGLIGIYEGSGTQEAWAGAGRSGLGLLQRVVRGELRADHARTSSGSWSGCRSSPTRASRRS